MVPDPELSDDLVDLRPGDTLFLYTDGVTEAHAPDHLLEPEDVARIVERAAPGDAADLVARVEEEVRSLGPGLPGDDIAMLAVRIPPAGERS